jgi:hypothetical protein
MAAFVPVVPTAAAADVVVVAADLVVVPLVYVVVYKQVLTCCLSVLGKIDPYWCKSMELCHVCIVETDCLVTYLLGRHLVLLEHRLA